VWGDEAALNAAGRRVDEWDSSLAERATKAAVLSRRLAELAGTATSDDRLVEVTVDSSGALVGLRLDEQIRAQPASRTAEQILAAIRAAHENLVRQASAATIEALGADDPAGRAVVDAYEKRLRPGGADA
jgi:DNA-binding protein YbaB